MLNGLFPFIFLVEIRNMQLCEDDLSVRAFGNLLNASVWKHLLFSSKWIHCVSVYKLLPVHLEKGRMRCSFF